MKSKKTGFTLVELLAVIAILAIVLLVAVPMILGVMEEAKEKAFRDSVLSLFQAIELNYVQTNATEGEIRELSVHNNIFTSGTWDLNVDTKTITLNQICDGNYKINSVTNQMGDTFVVEKTEGSCGFDIVVNGENPTNVNCSATESYQDAGAMYGNTLLTTTDVVDLTKAGTYQLQYSHGKFTATRIVNVSNKNTPEIVLKQEAVTIMKGDSFDASTYIESANDLCEGSITNKIQSESEVLTDVAGTYTVTYKVKNLGNIEATKTLTVTVLDLTAPQLIVPAANGENGWYKSAQTITVNYDEEHLDGYEYLRTSIMMAVEDAKVLNGITKILYPTIAKKCSSTDSGVERSIRTAIEVTWSRGNKETVNKIFGNTVSASTGRPTNSEFIALIADHIRMKLRG